MQMSEKLDKLKNLQEVLAEKYEIEAKVEELPKTLGGSTESLERFKKEYIEKNSVYEEKKAVVAQLREELLEAQKKREEGEKGMDAISTHREYEILEKQIEEAKSVEDAKRRDLQREEKNLSELSDILKSEEELIATTQADVDESRQSLDQELAAFNEKLEVLKAEELTVAEGLENEIVTKFQRIIRRNSKGIVAVKGNVCDGCHMVLPAQFANRVRKGEEILFCPYCSRILFYEEGAEGDAYYSTDNAGSLDVDDEDLIDENEDLIDVDEIDSEETDSVKSMDYEN